MNEITVEQAKERVRQVRPSIVTSHSKVNVFKRIERKEIVENNKGEYTVNYYTIGIEHSETEFCGQDLEKAVKIYNDIKL